MADPDMEEAIDEVEHIIKYQFEHRPLLSEAILSSRDPFPRGTNDPSLAVAGQMALEAISWQLFWATNSAKDVTPSDLDRALQFRLELDGDANLVRVVNRTHLYRYIATEIGVVSSRMRAILGAVWRDSDRNLEQVKDVMKALGMAPDEGVEGLALRLKNPLSLSERFDLMMAGGGPFVEPVKEVLRLPLSNRR